MTLRSDNRLRGTAASGVAAVVVATVLWAIGSVMTKHLLRSFGAIDLVATELCASTASLWVALALSRSRCPSLPKSARLSLPGLLQPGLAYSLAFVGLQWTSVSLETLLWSSESAFMLLFAYVFLQERASRTTIALGALAVAGVVVASLATVLGEQLDKRSLLGEALVLVAVLTACGYTVFAQKDLETYSPLPLVALHQLAGLLLVLLVRAVWSPSVEITGQPSLAAFGEAALAGLSVFSIPFWLFLLSIKRLGSATASQFLPLVPILTMLLASRALGERMELLQTIGTAITIAAVTSLSVTAARSSRRQAIDLENHTKPRTA